MNYIWDLLIHAEDQNIPQEKIYFVPSHSYSPYMELALEELNFSELYERIAIGINPYYRYEHVYEDLLPIRKGTKGIQLAMFDLFAHTLADVDMRRGMGRQDFEALFWAADILQGCFGQEIADAFSQIEKYKKRILLACLTGIYRTGPSLDWIRYFVRKCYENGIVYLSKEDQSLIMVYLGAWRTKAEEAVTFLLETLCLPLHFNVEWYYDQHFGIIGIDELMQMDEIVIC